MYLEKSLIVLRTQGIPILFAEVAVMRRILAVTHSYYMLMTLIQMKRTRLVNCSRTALINGIPNQELDEVLI